MCIDIFLVIDTFKTIKKLGPGTTCFVAENILTRLGSTAGVGLRTCAPAGEKNNLHREKGASYTDRT
jgi:hypothetical protein